MVLRVSPPLTSRSFVNALPAAILAVATSATLCGCSPVGTFSLPDDPTHARTNRQEREGLSVAAQLLLDPRSVQYHFGPDLRKEGIIPVFVYLENRGSSSFEIQRKSLSMILESGVRLEPISPRDVLERVHRSTLPALLFAPLVIPAIYMHRQIEDWNFQTAKTLHEKSLPPELRLEKGDRPIARAVFFQDPVGRARLAHDFESAVIQAQIEVEGSRSRPETPPAPGPSISGPNPTAASGGGEAAADESLVGRTLTFTVSLVVEDA